MSKRILISGRRILPVVGEHTSIRAASFIGRRASGIGRARACAARSNGMDVDACRSAGADSLSAE
ncbi:hypothetical protein [Frankia sp. AvcI1]|uniref:hypothetical protein n=1 Tax=Frankia sp. AvcI1 TaxID=573496 RepID=UPI0012FDCD3C|nr:hypothetical protein [Frankia sp. AvcI1]